VPRKKPDTQKGRPVGTAPKLTPEVQEGICASLKIGVPAKYAAEKQGIRERTYYDWLAKSEQGIQPYRDFALAVMRANAEGVCNLTARALAGGPGAAQATWLLERRFRGEYGQRIVVREAPVDDASQAESRIAAQIRASPAATKKLHEAITLAVEAAASNASSNGRPHSDG
jgi:hypothetical protein